MLKRQNKVLSLVLAFVFCMSFMFTGFAVPNVAEAASSYDVIKTETISNVDSYLTNVRIQIDVPNVGALSNGDIVTVHFPASLKMDNDENDLPNVASNHKQIANADPNVVFYSATQVANLCKDLTATPGIAPAAFTGPNVNNPTGAVNVEVWAPLNIGADTNALNYAAAGVPSFIAYPIGSSAVEIQIVNPAAFLGTAEGRLYVDLKNVKVTNTIDGDIVAQFVAPGSSGFSSGSKTIAKFATGGEGTFTTAKSVVTMNTAKTTLDTIMTQEVVKNSLKPGNVITLKLPKGFKWVNDAANQGISGGWAFTAGGATQFPGFNFGADVAFLADTRKIEITMPAATGVPGTPGDWTGQDNAKEGRIYFTGVIEVDDETEAKLGDVSVHISGDNVTAQDIIVANYAEYGVTVSEKSLETVSAGRDDTELGSFVIKEGMKDSLVPGRTVTLDLPAGVEWDVPVGAKLGNYTAATCINAKLVKGTNWVAAAAPTVNKNRNQLKLTLAAGAIAKSEIEIKELKVQISPDFTGDVVVKVGGTAGAEGEVKVATVVAPLTFADLDANATKIIIGKQGQKLPDVILVEGKKEAVKATPLLNNIAIELPDGATFDKLPTATVTDGDIMIDKVSYMAGRTGIIIAIKGTSDVPAKIKLSDLVATLDRTVPEGKFELYINAAGSTALQNTAVTFNVTYMGEKAIAQCVTPAPGEGTDGSATGQFKITSNIYYVNGVAKIMDVAPYIKGSRTYVPMRYVGEVMGAEVVWDATARTVTLTKGEKVVVFTIGSTNYTVNGEAKVADVAPEITNDRTMLPARFVAEGLGYVVGWDPGTQTVLISK